MNALRFQHVISNDALTLRAIVDGVDMLDEYSNSRGPDPNELLPPLTTRLLPTRLPRRVIIGICTCGVAGCGSLAISIRRSGNKVLWQPDAEATYETLRREYSFDLREYLDAVDDAVDNPPAGEGIGRRVARRVRMLLGAYDHEYALMRLFHQATVDWVSAWPWTSPIVRASVTTDAGQTVHEFVPQQGESEDHFAARIATELANIRMPD